MAPAGAGYWTAPGHRRSGLTAFDEVGLRRVELVVDARNTGSRRVGQAAGFRVEGTLRQRTVHRGEAVDDVVLGLLATAPRPDG